MMWQQLYDAHVVLPRSGSHVALAHFEQVSQDELRARPARCSTQSRTALELRTVRALPLSKLVTHFLAQLEV